MEFIEAIARELFHEVEDDAREPRVHVAALTLLFLS